MSHVTGMHTCVWIIDLLLAARADYTKLRAKRAEYTKPGKLEGIAEVRLGVVQYLAPKMSIQVPSLIA